VLAIVRSGRAYATGPIIMLLLWIGEPVRSLQSTISRHRNGLRTLFDDLQRGKRDPMATEGPPCIQRRFRTYQEHPKRPSRHISAATGHRLGPSRDI